MILNFAVEGFVSINEMQDVSFAAFNRQRIKNTKYEENYVLESPFREAKSILFFGNNAVGKTNIIMALRMLLNIIKDGKLPNEKQFNWYKSEMEFEIIVSNEKDFFEYAIRLHKDGYIIRESLNKNSNPVYIFENQILSSDFLDEKVEEIYSIRSTSPLLLKLKDFIYTVYSEFIESINDIKEGRDVLDNNYIDFFGYVISLKYKTIVESHKDLAVELLQQVDPSIIDISFRKSDIDEYNIKLHRYSNLSGDEKLCDLSGESNGVKKITILLATLLEIFEGKTLIIDELDSSISTRSLILIYNNFVNSGRNKNGQLIVTTHNLELLNLDLFAPEQIYILTKDETLSTKINSLSDFDLRSNNKRLAIKFLQREFEV